MAESGLPDDVPLATLVARPHRTPLTSTADPATVLAGLDADDHPAALWGDWFGGGVLIFARPLRRITPNTAAEAFPLVDDQPVVDTGSDFTGVGGGWLATFGYDDGATAGAFHDWLLRWTAADGWRFEALGLPGRAAAEAEARTWCRDRLTAAESQQSMEALQVDRFGLREPMPTARDHYLAAAESVIGRIHRGDFYQLNLCTRLHATTAAAAPPLFAQLAGDLQPAYGALVSGGAGTMIVSASPELFLRVRGTQVETRPIKGTTPRRAGEQDSPTLRASTKDAAENVMIVDLMRNDLSRVARPGTVRVDGLLDLEPHPGVWHLVSTVRGELADGVTVGNLLAAAFPPGSVTGAPKYAAQRGIAAAEIEPRGAYTGSLGLLSPCAGTDLSVIIRSFELAPAETGRSGAPVALGVGGGITADSVPMREWYECLHKAAPLVRALGTTLDPALLDEPGRPAADLLEAGVFETVLVRGGRAVRLTAHLARLERSCRELYAAGLPEDLTSRLEAALVAQPLPRGRLRLTVHPGSDETGLELRWELSALGPRLATSVLTRAGRPPRTWRHKWVDRGGLTAAEAASAPALPYFVSPSRPHLATETSRGSLFVLDATGVWCTPPLDEEVLPGVTRRELIDVLDEDGQPVQVRPVTVAELRTGRGAFWTSALSGAVAISAVDGFALADVTELTHRLSVRLGIARR